jgi:plastocyanin
MKYLLVPLALMFATAAAPAAPPTVRMANDAFTPTTLTVSTGTTVLFVNRDEDAHTVTAVNGAFDSKGLDTNGHWSYTFNKPGSYRYFCELHPFMKGTIVVKSVHV